MFTKREEIRRAANVAIEDWFHLRGACYHGTATPSYLAVIAALSQTEREANVTEGSAFFELKAALEKIENQTCAHGPSDGCPRCIAEAALGKLSKRKIPLE